MRSRAPVLILIVLFCIHMFLLGKADAERKTPLQDDGDSYFLLSPVLKITSLEFRGLASDLLFLKALVFYGSTYERKERPRIKPREWNWFYRVMDTATDLDPYFVDPYMLANASLTWEGGMIRETNSLLEKGSRARDWDWQLPFFIGFNHFYFLRDNAKAAEYLYDASKRPGPSSQLASLAVKLEFKERHMENAIIFLEAILTRTEDERTKKEFETRIQALRIRLSLEQAAATYKKKYGGLPPSLDALVQKGFIQEIPIDPYGGTFSIERQGRVASTSDAMLMPGQR